MASNTNTEPVHSDDDNPELVAIPIDAANSAEVHVMNPDQDGDGNNNQGANFSHLDWENFDTFLDRTEEFLHATSLWSHVESLTSFVSILDNLNEDRQYEAALQESFEACECLKRNVEREVDVAARFANDNEENTCIICQQEFSKGETIGTPPCKHDFHLHCLIEWGHYKAECPICKDVIPVRILEMS